MKCRTCGNEIDYSQMKDGYTGNECADCNLVRVLGLVIKENHIVQLSITQEKVDVANN